MTRDEVIAGLMAAGSDAATPEKYLCFFAEATTLLTVDVAARAIAPDFREIAELACKYEDHGQCRYPKCDCPRKAVKEIGPDDGMEQPAAIPPGNAGTSPSEVANGQGSASAITDADIERQKSFDKAMDSASTPAPSAVCKFPRGTRVRKIKGYKFEGRVCGTFLYFDNPDAPPFVNVQHDDGWVMHFRETELELIVNPKPAGVRDE